MCSRIMRDPFVRQNIAEYQVGCCHFLHAALRHCRRAALTEGSCVDRGLRVGAWCDAVQLSVCLHGRVCEAIMRCCALVVCRCGSQKGWLMTRRIDVP
jgi:hypothetical protein